MQRQIDDLKSKAEQGSQQLQGEVPKLEIEVMLQANFPMDSIKPAGKGEFGGDVLQRVLSPTGQTCGAILWESKGGKTGAMAGLQSSGWISARRMPRSPCWSSGRC